MKMIAISMCAVALGLAGCAGGGVGSNQADFIKALAADPASNCLQISVPVYGGGISAARAGGPGVKVSMAGGSCTIETLLAPPVAK